MEKEQVHPCTPIGTGLDEVHTYTKQGDGMLGQATTSEKPPLSDDLLHGADEISRFMYGETANEKAAESNRRKVYHASVKHGLPTFKLGGTMTARRSTILKWIERQEVNN